MSEISLQYLNAFRVAARRHRGAHYPRLTEASWQELVIWASPRQLLRRHNEARGVGLLWDDPSKVDPRDRRYDVGVPILSEDIAKVDAPSFVLITSPGRYLRALHQGAYEQIGETYSEILENYLPSEGWSLLAQPIVEVYRNSPSEVAEDDLITDLYFPVAKL